MPDMEDYRKLWVSLIMAALILIEAWLGWHVTSILTEEVVITILTVIWAFLVWIVPNGA